METLFFWKNWYKKDQRIYIFALAILALALLTYLVQFWLGDSAIIQWTSQSELEDLPVELDTFRRGIFPLHSDALNYIITERFAATDMAVNHTSGYLFLGLLALGAMMALTTITFLSLLWYAVGMASFIGLLVSFRFELIALFGWHNNIVLAVLLVLYGGFSYYFHAFRTDTSLVVRLLVFSLLTGLVATAVGLFTTVPYPALLLSSYGIVVPLVVTIVFTFIISTEIPYAFLYLITRSNTEGSGKSFLHFTVVSVIYVANLLVIYMKNAGIVDLNMLFFSPFLIFAVSAVLGIWGHQKRSILFEGIIAYVPYGALLYAALGIISLATVGYSFSTANDPLIEVVEDAIVFSHLAMGIVFFLYILVNFGGLLRQNMRVYKIAYKPTLMPYYMARAAAVLIMVSFFVYSNMAAYQQAIAGYYNGLGDSNTAMKEYFLAEQYYKMGSQYGWNNHKSNYALASLARKQNDAVAAGYYFSKATLKNPSPYDYASLSQILLQDDQFFKALFTLKEGIQKFPESGELYNNLALLYNRTSLADSAFLFFDQSRQFAKRSEVVESNLLAFWAKNNGIRPIDSLLINTVSIDYLPFQNNKTVLQNLLGAKAKKSWQPALANDSTLSRNTFAYLFNQAVGQALQPDTTLPRRLAALARHPANSLYAEELAFAHACYEYRFGNRGAAIEILKNLCQQATDRADFFNLTLGAWLLQQEAYRLSAEYSAKSQKPEARFNRAVALSQGGMEEEAKEAWQQIVQLADSVQSDKQPVSPEYVEMKPLAAKMLAIYHPTIKPESLDEEGKVMYLLYRGNQLTEADKGTYAELLPKVKELASHAEEENEKLFIRALDYENKGNLKQAETLYKQVLLRAPLNEKIIIHVSQFYRDKLKNNDAAYNGLVNTVQLNPYSVAVYKAYIRQSLAMGLLTYAEQGLETLKDITTPADYQAFLPEYQSKVALIEKQAEGFQ
ncbi:MAG: hypothetical protein V4714_11895 [Bacteroidota bacterium]